MKRVLLSLLFVGLMAGVSHGQIIWTPPFAPPAPPAPGEAGQNVYIVEVNGYGSAENVGEAFVKAWDAANSELDALDRIWTRAGWSTLGFPVDWRESILIMSDGTCVVTFFGDRYYQYPGG